jgi:hypothetical protein
MEILKFKTNIQSETDLQQITPLLNNESSIHEWKLDTSTSDNILNVSGTEPDPQLVQHLLQQAGFEADFIQVFGTGGIGL